MRVSIVGCGNISKCHIEVLKKIEDIEITSVCDILPERANAAAEKCDCKAYYDFDEMLNDDKPDAVHICTPHYLHVPMSVKALTKDIHVLCEKPCAISEQSLSQLKLAQSMSSARFGVCFQNRYNTSVQIVKDILNKKEYGNILSARAIVTWNRNAGYYSDDWHGTKLKEGGGVLVNQAIHSEDLLRYLTGMKIVSAVGHTFNDHLKGQIEVEDTAVTRFELEDGTIALYYATTAFGVNADIIIDFYCKDATIRIEGNNAYIIKNGEIEQLHVSEDADFIGKHYWGKGHESLIADFYDCIKTGRKFPVDVSEGGKSVEEFLAIYTSAEIGEKVLIKE